MKGDRVRTKLSFFALVAPFKRYGSFSATTSDESKRTACSHKRFRLLHAFVFLIGMQLLAGVQAQGQSVTITNVFQNHYHYRYPIGDQSCPSGYNIPAGQYSNAYHLERGHAIHHQDPANPSNDYWVYWAHFDNSSYGAAEVAVFKSTTECGPYILQTGLYPAYNTDGAGYGFQPGGWQSRDEIIFRDTNQTYNPDGSVNTYASAYLISASDSENSVQSSRGSTCSFANDSIAIFKLTPDYLGIDSSTNPATNGANWAFVCDQREAPVMFRKDNKYFLITSQAAGWYPSQGGYGVSDNPLTGWTPDPINLGNTSTFGGQTSDGFTIQGTQANTYVLTFDHLGGADSKNPSSMEKQDTGEMWLPVQLDSIAGTATLDWYPSWTVDNTTGVLTLPTLSNLVRGSAISSTVASASANPPSNAIDGSYTTRWASSSTGSASFNAANPATSTLCPVTGATSSTTCNPSLIVDLGSVQPVQEIDLSQYMVKGSEPYYTYKIAYSSDDVNWTTLDYTTVASFPNAAANNISDVPFSNNITYGFNALPVDFSARYVALIETGAITQNSTSAPYTSFYGPNLYEMAVIQSTASAAPQPVTVTVTPSTATPQTDRSFTVAVNVSGPAGRPTPSGYVQLSAPGYISETYGLVNGANSFTIPAGALTGGQDDIVVNYRPDPTSAPIYGIGATAGTSQVYLSAPDTPANVVLSQNSPGALLVSWVASIGATGYVVNRSSDGGATYTQVASVSTSSYLDTGLNNDSTTYCYTVAAVNGAGPGVASAPVCGTATANFPITGLQVSQSGPGALTISFSGIANVSGYMIKRSVAGGVFTQLVTAKTNSYVDSGLAVDGTVYCYTVAAVFSTGDAADSSPVCNSASTFFAPTGLQVTPWANGQLYLSWLAHDNATSYVVKRSINGGEFTTVAPAQSALTYIDNGLTNYSTVYCYVVDEVLNGVTSADSLSVCNTATNNFVAVPNNSFESPSEKSALWQTDGQISPSTANWIFSGASGSSSGNNSGISINTSGTWANSSGLSPDGSQIAFLEGTGSITSFQPISGFIAGQTYTIFVAASQRQTTSQSGPNPFVIGVNGAAIGANAPPQSVAYYRDYSASFTATAASNTIGFAGTSTSGTSAVLVDDVRIVTYGTGGFVITIQPVAGAYGAASATLTATATFTGSNAPASSLIFQVGGGNQIPGACSVSGADLTCSVSYSTSGLAAGTYPINVFYEGDLNYPQSSAKAVLTVNPAPTTTVVTGGAFPYDGNPHPATVSVTGAGGLAITASPAYSGSCTSAPITVTEGASCTASYSYPGDANHAGSSGSATITISPVYVKSVSLNLANTQLTYPGATNTVACVTSTTNTAATGTVQIMDGTAVLNTQPLGGNGCAYWYISPGLAAGTHSLSAFYSGDKNNAFGWSSPIAVVVQPVPVKLGVSCWNTSFPYGGNYQCTVNLSSNAGAVAGNITYALDGNPPIAVPLAGGNAQFTVTRPPAGSHTAAIAYTLQGNYAAAGPNLQKFTVTLAPVNVALTPSSWHTTAGTAITFQAAVGSWSAGPPNSTGSVSFYDGDTLLTTVPVDGTGSASFSSCDLAVGAHKITANYAGGANYANGSAGITITVAQ